MIHFTKFSGFYLIILIGHGLYMRLPFISFPMINLDIVLKCFRFFINCFKINTLLHRCKDTSTITLPKDIIVITHFYGTLITFTFLKITWQIIHIVYFWTSIPSSLINCAFFLGITLVRFQNSHTHALQLL